MNHKRMVHPNIIRVILGENEQCSIEMDNMFRFRGTITGLKLGFDCQILEECSQGNFEIVQLSKNTGKFWLVWDKSRNSCHIKIEKHFKETANNK